MENPQGSNGSLESAAIVQGSPAIESAGGVPPELQQYVATPSATPSDATQGGTQGGETQLGATQPSERERQLQSLADQRLAESLRYQQEVATLRQQALALPQQQTNQTNPYDSQADNARWWAWEKDDMAKRSATLANTTLMNSLQGLAQQNAEYTWQNNHPGVDVNTVKAFARSQGIAEWNLDAAHKLMNIPNQMLAVAQGSAQQMLNNFRQPQQSGASPLRGTQSAAPGTVQLRYADMVKAQAEDPNFITRFPQEVQDAFWKESYAARSALR